MSEDVSATMRVGVTVILVAALVAVVLNLMVMSQSILSNGQANLQSGIDMVSRQEFETYNNKKVSGTLVQTALSLYQGRDIAICIQTLSVKETAGPDKACNYGAVLAPGRTSGGAAKPFAPKDTVFTDVVGDGYYATFGSDSSKDLYQQTGKSTYLGLLKSNNGLIQFNSNTIGTTTIGNPQYLLSSGRYNSTLIQDSTGNIIGILFVQIS